ncbi:hypothetical protein [Photobacterium leiognathi]|uniref:hypothetical protein n=1 Tax=Photobacterium leiognathi TaxID=553611 RepID=UPI002980FDA1|nr:hypothetical protein [Photobacterium leiognathi]
MKELEILVYSEQPFGDKIGIPEDTRVEINERLSLNIKRQLPGLDLEDLILNLDETEEEIHYQYTKLTQSCRKLCVMWYASEQALEAEREFYSTTVQDAPALFGDDAVKIHYHLESFVLLARSAMDVATGVIHKRLPYELKKNRYDSFNSLIKDLSKVEPKPEIAVYFEDLKKDPKSWVSIISDSTKGRSLRDKLAHQTDFPLDYAELNPPSEKESPIVWLDKENWLPLESFVNTLREGVIEGFMELEAECCSSKP